MLINVKKKNRIHSTEIFLGF